MAVRRINKSQDEEVHQGHGLSNKVKRLLIGIVILLLILGMFWYKTKSWPIVAMVGLHPITRFEAAQVLFKQGGKAVVDDLVTQVLIKNELRKNHITVTNADIDSKIEEIKQTLGQNTSLDEALTANGLTLQEFRNQLSLRIGIEKILANKISVTEDEVNSYFQQDAATIASATDEAKRNQAREMLKTNKLQTEANNWITELKKKTKVWEFSGF